MSNWDDEDFEPSTVPVISASKGKWEGEDEDEDDIPDEWDAESEDEKPKTIAAPPPPKPKKSVKQAIAEREERERKAAAEKAERKAQGLDLSDIDEDPKARRERERAAELAADEAVARELLKNTSLKPAANGTATDIASQQPRTKDEFDEYSKQVAAIITSHQQSPQYAMFIAGLAKAICEPLGSEDVKKVSSGLTTLMNEKLKAEKGSGGKAKKGKAKPSLVVGVAKSAAPKFDTQAYDEADDFDDFM